MIPSAADGLAGMGVMQFIGPILAGDGFFGDYNATWFAMKTITDETV